MYKQPLSACISAARLSKQPIKPIRRLCTFSTRSNLAPAHWPQPLARQSRRKFSGQASSEAAQNFLPYISDSLLPIITAIILFARKDNETSQVTEEVPLEVLSVPEKGGQGAFASRNIGRGEIIITEAPLVVWPSDLSEAQASELFEGMTPSAQALYKSLANAQPSDSTLSAILAIRATNGFTVQLPPIPSGTASSLAQQDYISHRNPSHASFIFPRISRINHSCLPNSDHAIDWSTLTMTVYATTDIVKGEEISIEYQAGMIQKSREERRRVLNEAFAFQCACSLCGSSDEDVRKSDERRKEITRLVHQVGEAGAKGVPGRKDVVEGLTGIKRLLRDEGYKASSSSALYRGNVTIDFFAVPEFENEAVSSAYTVFATMEQPLQA